MMDKPGLFQFISWQFRKYYSDEKTARTILRQMFEHCPDDVEALDGKLGRLLPAFFSDQYFEAHPELQLLVRYAPLERFSHNLHVIN